MSLTRDFLPESIGPTIQKPGVQIRPWSFLHFTALGQLVSLCASVHLFTKCQGGHSERVILRITNSHVKCLGQFLTRQLPRNVAY